MNSTRKIVLTGARGSLACCLRPALEARGREVVPVSRVEGGGFVGLEELFLTRLPEQADAILHLAWSTLPAFSERNVGIEWERDLPLLFRLLRRVADSPDRERIHFVFFSSGGTVYGHSNGELQTEDTPCRPVGWHGQAKRAAEEIVGQFATRHGLRTAILRISNLYGFPVPRHRPQGLIPHAVACAMEGRPLALWGDGSARKDFLHCDDLVAAVDAVVERRLTGVFNLCAGRSETVRDVLSLVEQATGRRLQLEPQPAAPWDVRSMDLCNRRLCTAADWRPEVPLPAGIGRMVRTLYP